MNIGLSYTLCEVTDGAPVPRHRRRLARKIKENNHVMAERFRRDRLACWLTPEQAAKILHVTPRTLHNWEAGATRIPYSAYKLMRILRGCELPVLAGPRELSWHGWYFQSGKLISPEGRAFVGSDFAWLSLLAERARLGWKRCLPTPQRGAVSELATPADSSVRLEACASSVTANAAASDEAGSLVPTANRGLKGVCDSNLLSVWNGGRGLFPGAVGQNGAVGSSSNTSQKLGVGVVGGAP